jgi:hypothetical protein
MEFVLACLAGEAWKAVVGCVDDTVTDRTLLNTFKFLVKIALPDAYCFS